MFDFVIESELTQPQRVQAASRDDALGLAESMGVILPRARLAVDLAGIAHAHYDVRANQLVVILPDGERVAWRYLRHEYGFRERDQTGLLTAVWSPEREDGLIHDLGLAVTREDGLPADSDLGVGSADYYPTIAVLAFEQMQDFDARVLWRRIEAQRKVLAQWSDKLAENGDDALSWRWHNRLTDHLNFLMALSKVANADLYEMLNDMAVGDEVEVSGSWWQVDRINQKSARLVSLDTGHVDTVGFDRITNLRKGRQAPTPAADEPQIEVGDFVFNRTMWMPVVRVERNRVIVFNGERQRHVARRSIRHRRSREAHEAALARDKRNARQIEAV